jgi:hypothetical protein
VCAACACIRSVIVVKSRSPLQADRDLTALHAGAPDDQAADCEKKEPVRGSAPASASGEGNGIDAPKTNVDVDGGVASDHLDQHSTHRARRGWCREVLEELVLEFAELINEGVCPRLLPVKSNEGCLCLPCLWSWNCPHGISSAANDDRKLQSRCDYACMTNPLTGCFRWPLMRWKVMSDARPSGCTLFLDAITSIFIA